MASSIHQHHPDSVIPYLLVISNVLPYVLMISALGGICALGGVGTDTLPLA